MPLHEHDAEPVFDTWGEFYAEYQIRPYIPRALRNGSIDDDDLTSAGLWQYANYYTPQLAS